MNRSVPALAVLCLTALTACGGGGEPANSTGEPRPTATRSEQAAPAERLAGLMVTPAEVKGYAVKPYDDQFALATSSSEMTADKPACTPLALALNQLPLGLIGIGLGTVLLPTISHQLGRGADSEAMTTQNRGLELALFFTLPATVALVI